MNTIKPNKMVPDVIDEIMMRLAEYEIMSAYRPRANTVYLTKEQEAILSDKDNWTEPPPSDVTKVRDSGLRLLGLKCEWDAEYCHVRYIPQRPSNEEVWSLMNRIYIARNISMNEATIHECLRTIDKWMAEAGRDDHGD